MLGRGSQHTGRGGRRSERAVPKPGDGPALLLGPRLRGRAPTRGSAPLLPVLGLLLLLPGGFWLLLPCGFWLVQGYVSSFELLDRRTPLSPEVSASSLCLVKRGLMPGLDA